MTLDEIREEALNDIRKREKLVRWIEKLEDANDEFGTYLDYNSVEAVVYNKAKKIDPTWVK